MERIRVVVDKSGKVTIEALGVVGRSCQELTERLEMALGVTTGDAVKEEFYVDADQRVSQS